MQGNADIWLIHIYGRVRGEVRGKTPFGADIYVHHTRCPGPSPASGPVHHLTVTGQLIGTGELNAILRNAIGPGLLGSMAPSSGISR